MKKQSSSWADIVNVLHRCIGAEFLDSESVERGSSLCWKIHLVSVGSSRDPWNWGGLAVGKVFASTV